MSAVNPGDVQRLFLQAVLSRGILSYNHASVLWEKCIDAVNGANPALDIRFSNQRADWDAFVASINDSLNSLDLEFRQVIDERTGEEMYALVNTRGDEIAQMATDYTPTEIAYFKSIVEQIMLAPHECYSISSLAALREVNSLKTNMTKAQAEAVLSSLVAKGWLLKSKRGRYSLSPRTLLELLPYLKSTYPDECLECTICMEIVTSGVACATPNCQTRMHQHCQTRFRTRHPRSLCPACQVDWPQDGSALKPVGEAAIRDGQDEGRRTRRRSTPAESDDEQDAETDEDGLSQRPTQSQRRGKQRQAVEDTDEDAEEMLRRSQARTKARRRIAKRGG